MPSMQPPKPDKASDIPGRAEEIFDGLGVGPGVAIGVVYRHDAEAVAVSEYRIPANRVEAEQSRFAEAVALAGEQIQSLREKARGLDGTANEELGYLLEAYQQMLHGSRLIRGVNLRIVEQRINAEAAVQQEIDRIAEGFAAMGDAYLSARATDICDLGRRLIRALTGADYRPFQHLPRRPIIVAEELTPADTALLDPSLVLGIVTQLGGTTSHTAIMARSLGLPAVLGVQGLMKRVRNGDILVLDGRQGRVILNPAPETLDIYRRKRLDFLRVRRALGRLRDLPAITRDGSQIQLQANIELPGEVDAVLAAGAAGVGLLRSEFLFMNRDDVPGEEEQVALLRPVVEAMAGRTVTIRTLDVGGDKLAHGLGIHIGPNPALGLRAVRLSLARPELLDHQLAAILRVGVYGPVRILVPMVATLEELKAVRVVLDRVVRRLHAQRIPIPDPLPPLGVMIEIPGAALAADSLAWHADFFAIGTNDLTQYTLAIDRADEAVAHLYNPLHPAVLRLIQFSVEAALRARISICVCGEVAGDPRFTPLLLGLGIRDLSMSANSIPEVKRRVRSLDLMTVSHRARIIMDQSDGARIAQLMDGFDDL